MCQMRLGERLVILQQGWAPPIVFGTVSKICVESFQWSICMQNLAIENGLNEKPGRETHVTIQVQVAEGERE